MTYIVYGSSYCGFCKDALRLLMARGFKPDYREIDSSPKHMIAFKERFPGVTTVPQILDPEGNHIGGFDKLKIHFGILS